jgi:hypothetical protein
MYRIMNPTLFIVSFIIAAGLFFSGCNSTASKNGEELPTDVVHNPNTAKGPVDSSTLPAFKFEETEHDFGRIIEGETVAFSFNFVNSGKSDLVIAEVSTSCGCTVPSYSKIPIRPGEAGMVKVTFNSHNRKGFQSKNIVVVANTQPNVTTLRIKAQVVNPKDEK